MVIRLVSYSAITLASTKDGCVCVCGSVVVIVCQWLVEKLEVADDGRRCDRQTDDEEQLRRWLRQDDDYFDFCDWAGHLPPAATVVVGAAAAATCDATICWLTVALDCLWLAGLITHKARIAFDWPFISDSTVLAIC